MLYLLENDCKKAPKKQSRLDCFYKHVWSDLMLNSSCKYKLFKAVN